MRRLKPGIYAVGAIDWDARLFDRLIPLPDGTSYNSYLVRGGEKTALLDTVDPANAEQDHSGSLPEVLLIYPDAKVVTNPKCKQMLIDLLGIEDEKFITVDDGQELSLGEKTLRFVYTPWVHWPETMSTYVPEEKILFSCDFFGAHLATSSLFVDDEAAVYESAEADRVQHRKAGETGHRNDCSKSRARPRQARVHCRCVQGLGLRESQKRSGRGLRLDARQHGQDGVPLCRGPY
jgi:flavorubredoxin